MRLIVRRVPDINPANQNPLFTVYRHHAVLTNPHLPMLAAESAYRGHAIVEQVIADLRDGPLAHLQSGKFWANTAWLVCAAMAFNLTRTAMHARLHLPRPSHLRNDPGPAHHHPREAGPLCPPPRAAPAARLAWQAAFTQLAQRHGTDHPHGLTRSARPTRTRPSITWRPPAKPGRPKQARAKPATSPTHQPSLRPIT